MGWGRVYRTLLPAVLVLGACQPATPPAPPVPSPGQPFFVAGYHPWWAAGSWDAYPLGALDRIYFFELEISAEGGIGDARGWPAGWTALVRAAGEAGADVVPAVTLPDPDAFDSVFSSPGTRSRLARELVDAVEALPGVAGVHLDVEVFAPVSPEARDGYTAFVAELKRLLESRMPGTTLSGFLLAFDPGEAYNEAALAQLLDYVVVQGYDLHYLNGPRSGPLGPVEGWDGLNLEAVLAGMDAAGVPRGRTLLSLPLYGYEWPTEGPEAGSPTRGPGVALPLSPPDDILPELPRAEARARAYDVERDPAGGGLRYAYRSDEGWYQGWFDDARSLERKVAWARAAGLGGVAFFPLAYASPTVWELIGRLHGRP